MRPFEWLIAAAVVVIAWYWFRGRRLGRLPAQAAALAVVASILVEQARVVMVPAYLVVTIAALLSLRAPATSAPKGGWFRILGRGTLALVVVILGVVMPWLWPVIKLPTPTGRHPVGTMWLAVRDTTRRERFTTVPGAVREFPVKVWYPAPPGTVGTAAPYALPGELTALGIIPDLLARQVRLVKTHSLLGVPVAQGRAPVLVFSHGYTGYAAQNTPQMEELASRGYIVASIAHPGEAALAPFPDGRNIPIDTSIINGMKRQMAAAKNIDPKRLFDSLGAALTVPDPAARQANFRAFLKLSPEPLQSQSVREWALDTKALLDVFENLNAGAVQSPFKERMDLERIGIFGMSYGGATAGEFCRQDKRCKVAVNIDGGQYGGLVDDSLMVPLLILASEQAYGVHVPVLDLTRGPAFLARVPATTHMGLTDMTLQGPVLYRWTGLTGKLDPDRREAIMTEFVLGFFEKYLMGRPSLFDSLPGRFPDVQITRRNVQ
jgi:predicted dienelactone hydrolase